MAIAHSYDFTSREVWSLCWVCGTGSMRCHVDQLECDVCGHREGVC